MEKEIQAEEINPGLRIPGSNREGGWHRTRSCAPHGGQQGAPAVALGLQQGGEVQCLEEDFARAVAVGLRRRLEGKKAQCATISRGRACAVGDFWGGGEGAVLGGGEGAVLPDVVLRRERRHRTAILGRRVRWCHGGERRGGM
jgi:hypothetical protein